MLLFASDHFTFIAVNVDSHSFNLLSLPLLFAASCEFLVLCGFSVFGMSGASSVRINEG